LVKPGEKVPVGSPLAFIKEDGNVKEVKPETARPGVTEPRIRISPVARKLAEKLSVDLTAIKGTGPDGRIQREDVERAARVTPPKEVRIEMPNSYTDIATAADRMRRAIAAAMARSKREIPHYYLATPINMSRAVGWLESENANRAIKDRILYSVLLIKAVALALREMPEFNATWEGDHLNIKPSINIGTAISLRQGGLVSPAIKNTDKESLEDLMKSMRDLVQRARAGTLRSSELSESTITVTNLGEDSIETVFGIIYPPQVALVGFGKLFESFSVNNGSFKTCQMINATLSGDHRASDGHQGARFLSLISKLLQEPEKL
jgi:pyruvate dehydrogenase E2 component (dihydrolipoamide acetyltransferase)